MRIKIIILHHDKTTNRAKLTTKYLESFLSKVSSNYIRKEVIPTKSPDGFYEFLGYLGILNENSSQEKKEN